MKYYGNSIFSIFFITIIFSETHARIGCTDKDIKEVRDRVSQEIAVKYVGWVCDKKFPDLSSLDSKETNKINNKIKFLVFYGYNHGIDLFKTILSESSDFISEYRKRIDIFNYHKMNHEEELIAFDVSFDFGNNFFLIKNLKKYIDKTELSTMIAKRRALVNLNDVNYRSRTTNVYEIAFAFVFRWEIIFKKTTNSIALGEGLSFVNKIPAYETKCFKWKGKDESRSCVDYRESNKLLNYILIELTTRDLIQDLEIVYRIHHRSGFNGNGSNAHGLGLRVSY